MNGDSFDTSSSSAPPPQPPEVEKGLQPGTLDDTDRLMLVFSYLGPLSLIPLFGNRDPWVRWHARQGLALFIVGLGVLAIIAPFDWLFSMIPLFGRIFWACEILVGLAFLAVIALCIERALSGGRFRLPWLADLADQD